MDDAGEEVASDALLADQTDVDVAAGPDAASDVDSAEAPDTDAHFDADETVDVLQDGVLGGDADANLASDVDAELDAAPDADASTGSDADTTADEDISADAVTDTDAEAPTGSDADPGSDEEAAPDGDTALDGETAVDGDAVADSAADAPEELDEDGATSGDETDSADADETDTSGPPPCVSDQQCGDDLAACWQFHCVLGICVLTPVDDNSPCDDGDACTLADACSATGCSGTWANCDDGDACTTDACDHVLGCTAVTVTCDDGDACTTDACDHVLGCTAVTVTCNDGDACTADACDHVLGCTAVTLTCDDGDACNGVETCDAASGCMAGTAPTCNDGDACTTDACDHVLGCTAVTLTCDDGDACTTDACDHVLGCAAVTVTCDDGDACTTDACDHVLGCAAVTVTCDDGDACTTDACDHVLGCTAVTLTCDDGDACTTDACDHVLGCTAITVTCDDGDACTTDACDHVLGCAAVTVTCDDGDACTTDACDHVLGCTAVTLTCDDGDACNGLEICDAASGCKVGTAPTCNDGDACNGVETCDAASGCKAGTAPTCNDGDACNGVETCDAASGCKAGTALTCNDGDACNGLETCDVTSGCKAGTAPTCNDGDACNGLETCDVTSGCKAGIAPTCNDGDACNGLETCDVTSGCKAGTALTCNDGDACNGLETCDVTSGCKAGIALVCNDGDACNGVETCDVTSGCKAGTAPTCDDGGACNGVETCDAASGCKAGTAPTCDDGDACTTDTCEPGSGCAHAACDDGSLCTTDSCVSGSCAFVAQFQCSDPVVFSSFTNRAASWSTVGNASVSGSLLRVTPAAVGQQGSAWLSEKLAVREGFTASFTFEFAGATSPAAGGDGMAFVVQAASVAQAGSEIGGPFGIKVGFDSYQNSGETTAKRIVVRSGTVTVTAVELTGDWTNSGSHSVVVTYTPGSLTVQVDGTTHVNNLAIDLANSNSGLDGDGKAWVGFTARTGSAYESHDVIALQVTPSCPSGGCGDSDACTVESCAAATGCVSAARCDDGDACTNDSCDAERRTCSHTALDCSDGDACTADSCSASNGCGHSTIGTGGDVDNDGVCASLDPCPLSKHDDSNGNQICDNVDFCNLHSAMTLNVTAPVSGDYVSFNYEALFEALTIDDLDGSMTFTSGNKSHKNAINSGIIAKGETWTATSTLHYPGASCPANVVTFSVANHVPVCTLAAVTPSSPSTTDELACNCLHATDKEFDITSYACVFTNQAGVVLPSAQCKLPASQTESGQRVTCAVTPSDSAGPGGAAMASVNIGTNQAPIGKSTWKLALSSLTSNKPQTDTIYCYEDNDPYLPLVNSASYGDPDLIYSTYRFRWTVNGIAALTTTNASTPLGSTTLQAVYTGASDSSGATVSYKEGDSVGCTMDLWDGIAASTQQVSTTQVVSGVAPEIQNVVFSPDDFGAYETVSCVSTLYSLDGDPLTWRTVLKQSSSSGATTTRYDSGLVAYTPTAGQPFTVSGSAVANPTLGSQFSCEIYVTDNDGNDASGLSMAIPAARPRASAVQVAGSSTCEAFTCSGLVSDADTVGGVTQDAYVEVTFLLNGLVASTTTTSVSGIGSGGKAFSVSASDLSLASGDLVTCSVRASNTGTGTWSSPEVGAAVSVSGAAPSYAGATLTAPTVPLTQDVLTCAATAPLSTCSATASTVYSWYANGDLVAGATGASFDTSGLSSGSVVRCGVQARSGSALGPVVKSSSVTLGTGDWVLTGVHSGERAGFSAAVVGDVNGDGLAELAVGAPNAPSGGLVSAGAVYLVAGSSNGGSQTLASAALQTYAGETGSWDTTTSFCTAYSGGCTPEAAGDTVQAAEGPIGDGLGVRVLAPGDVDGDEVGDLVLAAPYAKASGGFRSGRVYVLSGSGLLATTPATVASGAASIGFAVDGEDGIDLQVAAAGGTNLSGDLFGFGLAAGDVDGDGLQDLTIGAPHFGTALTDVAWGTPEYNAAGGDTGKVYTIFGASDQHGANWLVPALAGETSLRQRTFTGKTILNYFAPEWGGDVAGLMDLNGDGRDESYVGFLGLALNGYVLPGAANAGDVDSESSTASELWPLPFDEWDWNPLGGSSFLQQVDAGHLPLYAFPNAAGDVNGDGFGDAVVPWWAKQSDGSTQLELTVYLGSASRSDLALSGPLTGSDGWVVRGTPKDGSIAGAVDTAAVGDVNGDGLDDFAFWFRPRTGTTNASYSRVYVVYGKTSTSTVTLTQLEGGSGGFTRDAGGLIAWGGVSGGDVDGDGLSELLVGAYSHDSDRGRLEVRFGRDSGAISQRGSSGSDSLTGTTNAEVLVGGSGADTLSGGGGADALLGGSGDDRLTVADTGFRRVRGGAGTDTLVVLSTSVDLRLTRGKLQDVEVIELSSGNQTLTLTSTDIRRLSPSSNRLIVLGDSADQLVSTASSWTKTGLTVWQGKVLHVFSDGLTKLLVQDGLRTSLPPVVSTTSLSVGENAASGTVVGVVEAVDPDGSIVQLVLDTSAAGIFGFDAATGTLTVLDGSALDHETQAVLTIQISAVDNDGNSTAGTVVVHISDVAEAPTFAVLAPSGVVEEGSAAGTHVATCSAADPDEGDVLTYTLEAGNSDGAFSVGATTGVVSIADGFALDHETEPYRELHVRVTDSAGLHADVLLSVVISDLETFEQSANYTFSTIGQGFFSQAPSLEMGFGVAGGFDIGDGPSAPESKSLSAKPFFWGSGTLWTDGTFDWTALAQLSTGLLNASIPVDVSVEFPDSIQTGVPFAIQTSWNLGGAAKFFGTAPKFTITTAYEMDQFQLGGQMDLQTAFGGTGSSSKSFGTSKYTGDGSFSVGVGGDEVSSVRFADAYPGGTSVGPDNASSALGHMAKALGLGDPADGTIAINKPNLLMIPSWDSGVYSGYRDWDTWFRESLPLYASATSGKLAYTLVGVDFLLQWGILQGWVYLWLGLEQGYYLDLENVVVTITLENGQTLQVNAGESANVTLPAGADVNGDGRVSVSASFSLVARLYMYTEPYWRYDSYQNWGWATLKSTRQDVNEFSGQPYTRTIRTDSWGPLASWGFTFQQNFDGQVAEGAEDVPDGTEMKAVVTTDLEAFEPKSFVVGGWNKPVMTGAIQLTP